MSSAAETYEQAAIDHGKYMGKNPTACNRAHDRLHRALKELRAQSDHGEAELLGLVNHADDSVRGWAATHLLRLRPDIAIPVLEHIASGSGFTAFDALMVLKEWRAGRLKAE